MEINLSNFTHVSDLVEAMPDALVIVDQSGKIVLINRQTEALFGYKRHMLLGLQVERLMPERFRNQHPNHRNIYFTNPRVRPMGTGLELFGLNQDGTEFPIEISLSPLNIEQGQFALAAIRDITIRKKAEAKFKAILEATPDCLVIINQEGKIILVNALAEKLFGYTPYELIGQLVELLIPERYLHRHEGHRHNYFNQPRTRPMGAGLELYGRHKNGDEFPVEISLSPLDTEEGLLTLAAVRDVTAQKRLEDQLRTKNVELENANLAKDRFFATMSHELRTPLNAILGFSGTLLMKMPGDINVEQEKQLKIVQNSAKHLLSLINDLLDLAKIDSGKVSLYIEKIDCQELIQEVMTSLRPLAEEKKLTFTAKLPAKKIMLNSDKRLLTQIMINIINNAIKFTDEGSVCVELAQKKLTSGDAVVIEVIDTGIGIKTVDLEQLFQAFQQLSTPGRKREGSGLGLSVSKKLADLIHATLEISSVFGKGTKFSILIPCFQE